MWNDLLTAGCLVLVVEGVLPFLSPARTREALRTAADFNDRTLRLIGLGSMVLGVLSLYLLD